MSTILCCLLLLYGLFACSSEQPPRILSPLSVNSSPSTPIVDTIPTGLRRFVTAYPQQEFRATATHLIWPDGFSLPYDSSMRASFWDSLEQPSLALQLAQAYPLGEDSTLPRRNQDPGRIRVDAFFKKMYGEDKAAVQAHLVAVDFLGTRVRVTTINGVDNRLAAVAKALEAHPEWWVYCLPVAGTFNWRTIAGTTRQSSHSYGIAIDLAVKKADYWRWNVAPATDTGVRSIPYRNRLPLGLVALFEKEGFIWGGKWYHYDTMHFEYRPELL